MLPEYIVEGLEIFVGQCLNLLVSIGMAPDGSLAEYHQRPCENIGAFNRNGYGSGNVTVGEQVSGSLGNGGTALYVHRIVYYLSSQLCEVVFCNSSNHGRFISDIESAAGITPAGFH